MKGGRRKNRTKEAVRGRKDKMKLKKGCGVKRGKKIVQMLKIYKKRRKNAVIKPKAVTVTKRDESTGTRETDDHFPAAGSTSIRHVKRSVKQKDDSTGT